jgi:nucleoside-diphosphate-sugar epimerase
MKIVVIGGTGLIGSKTVERLRNKGHDVLAASPNSGVNTITGEGLAEALKGASVVLDLANSPSFEEKAVLEFFQPSQASSITSHCRWSAPSACRAAAISAARWPRRT